MKNRKKKKKKHLIKMGFFMFRLLEFFGLGFLVPTLNRTKLGTIVLLSRLAAKKRGEYEYDKPTPRERDDREARIKRERSRSRDRRRRRSRSRYDKTKELG